MKSVLISIKPKWCELIASGKKTIEVRKTAPKLQTPFKCYIYTTKPKKFIKGYADDDLFRHVDGRIECGFSFQLATEKGAIVENNILSGKVIGEFVCDRIDKYSAEIISCAKFEVNGAEVCEEFRYNAGACLDAEAMFSYSKGKSLYGWHISNLKIYDKPKELGEFCVRSNHPDCEKCANVPAGMNAAEFVWHNDFCGECRRLSYKSMWATHFRKRLSRPPQSWCYVEGA